MNEEETNLPVEQPAAANPLTPEQPAAPLAPAEPATPAGPEPIPTDQPSQAAALPQPNDEPIGWTASEFIAHDKSSGWYGILALVAVVVAVVVYLLTHDLISATVIVLGALFFGIFARRQPRQIAYRLNHNGLWIGQRHLPLDHFRSFAVVPEGAFSSIVFMPLKRFAPLTTVYYPPEEEERILDVLSEVLPYAEHQHDPIERLMRHIRF